MSDSTYIISIDDRNWIEIVPKEPSEGEFSISTHQKAGTLGIIQGFSLRVPLSVAKEIAQTLLKIVECPNCRGTGAKVNTNGAYRILPCPTCNGSGDFYRKGTGIGTILREESQ